MNWQAEAELVLRDSGSISLSSGCRHDSTLSIWSLKFTELEEEEKEEGEKEEIEDAKKTVKSRVRSLLIHLRGKKG